jgi:hypothetical protein
VDTMKTHNMFIQSATTQFGGLRRRVVVAILVLLVLSTVVHAQGNWIFDDFDDGDAADGHPFTWQKGPASPGYAWSMMDGDYVLTSNRTSGIPGTTSSTVLESVGTTGDVSVRCRLHFLDLIVQSAGVSARGTNGDGYYAGIARGGVVFVGESGGDAFYLLTDLRPRDEDVTVQLDIIGDNISMKAWRPGDPEPSAPLLAFTDATFTTGAVAVWVEARNDHGDASAAFRNFGTNALPNTTVPRDATLSWTTEETATSFDVYLGTNFQDVDAADRANSLDVLVSQDQDANAFDPNGRLEFGQTYYWRIDEVGAAPDSSIIKGDVQDFTVEPFSLPIEMITVAASSTHADNMGPENTINGSGLDALDQHGTMPADMWLSARGEAPVWIQYEFDKAYKLHEMWVWNSNELIEPILGLGAKDVTIDISTNGTDWTSLESIPQFAQGTGSADYSPNTTVDFGNTVAKYVLITIDSGWDAFLTQYGLSELRFFHIPMRASQPQPADVEMGANPETPLSWRAGRGADSHEVYLSTDRQAVLDGSALVDVVSEPRYEPGTLAGETTYYWKINEVNEPESQGSAEGDWIFDDFEDGDAVDGHPFTWLADSSKPGGTREVVGGDYVLTHNGEADSDVLESVGATGDVSVRSQMRFSNSDVGNAAIYARAVAGISYYAGLTRSGRVHVGQNGGAYHSVQTNLRPVDQDVTVQLDIIGDNISVKAWPSGDPEPEAPLKSFADSTLTVGTVGVYMYGNTPEASVAFRNFGVSGLPNTSDVPHWEGDVWEFTTGAGSTPGR